MPLENDESAVPVFPMSKKRPHVILLAEDDQNEQEIVLHALREAGVRREVRSVTNGQELLNYLRRKSGFSNEESSPSPGLILLDLNMPTLDGREALRQIRADPELRGLPVIVLTNSATEEDVRLSESLGVDSLIIKPSTFGGLVDALKSGLNPHL